MAANWILEIPPSCLLPACMCVVSYLKGSVSWTSSAAPRILPSFSAWARAFSSTRPPRAVLTRNAPWRICGAHKPAGKARLQPHVTVSLAEQGFDGHVRIFLIHNNEARLHCCSRFSSQHLEEKTDVGQRTVLIRNQEMKWRLKRPPPPLAAYEEKKHNQKKCKRKE